MFHLHPGSFGLGYEDPREDRDRMHRVALHEARVATEHRDGRHNDLALADGLRARRFGLASASGSADLSSCCA